ncbi:MAG: gluconolaconase [Bacteroidales bacterium]|nr:gluconolaconase [Bacteroidales bacterium]
MHNKSFLLILQVASALLLLHPVQSSGAPKPSSSVYTQRPDDPYAVYFEAQSGTDVTAVLQATINDLKQEQNFGIVFIPEGKYIISNTIYIPNAIRLIGYGKRRPEFILADNSPGFQTADPSDKGEAKYMFWFTGGVVRDEKYVRDAGAGTFYSALTNIDLRIGKGNPCAVALRTHYAQHCFISFCDINIGSGKAGLFDVGNEMDHVRFFGGDYGIYTTKTSPSWQFTMLNTEFEGQRKAAVRSQEGGWIIKRMRVKNTPVAFEIDPARHDKLFMEDCILENISDAAIVVSEPDLSPNQVSILNTSCSKVPVAVRYRNGRAPVKAPAKVYRIDSFTLGLHQDDMAAEPEFRGVCNMTSLDRLPALPEDDIPAIPSMDRWVNIATLGAVGDNATDNTEVFRKAIEKYDVIYVPQGDYVVTGTITLRENTALIGLNPISTQLVLHESTPAFSGFGAPVPLLETPCGGKNFVSGIGINTGGYNYRGVGIKWQAGAGSYLNDVKFLGIHGTMKRPSKNADDSTPRITRIPPSISTPDNPVPYLGKDKAWDNQHWSLWVTNGGGGVFKDLWSADTYATSGILISDTDTPGTMYEISVEHHVRNEVTLRGVSNWKLYGLQLEEELRESPDVQQIEIQDCHNLFFANLYLFRVIWIETPLRQALRLWGDNSGIEFYNLHNFTQMRLTTDVVAHDVNSGLSVFPWELTRLSITGKETPLPKPRAAGIKKIVTGFEYLEGITADSKGNVYFSEQRMRRIYRLDAGTGKVTLVCDLPWPILSLGCDTRDNLLVCIKYVPQPGNAAEARAKTLPDAAGTTFSWWGNSGFEPRVFAIDPADPEESVKELPLVESASLKGVERVFLPSHRWRDLHDFEETLLSRPKYSFVAPDGKTIIPEYYDLLRSSALVMGEPGKALYTADEYNHCTYKTEIGPDGSVKAVSRFASVGEFSSVPGPGGKVFVADGLIYVYDAGGKLEKTIRLPERPASIICRNGRLVAAARTSLYEIQL